MPPQVEYALTPLGRSMLEPLTELTKWAEKTHAEVADRRRTFDA